MDAHGRRRTAAAKAVENKDGVPARIDSSGTHLQMRSRVGYR